jgi:hypothetical protein
MQIKRIFYKQQSQNKFDNHKRDNNLFFIQSSQHRRIHIEIIESKTTRNADNDIKYKNDKNRNFNKKI